MYQSVFLPILPSFVVAHLFGDQCVVEAPLGQQLLMCALFHHHAALEDHDAVSVFNGGQAMGHHDARPALPGLVQRFLHHLAEEGRTRLRCTPRRKVR